MKDPSHRISYCALDIPRKSAFQLYTAPDKMSYYQFSDIKYHHTVSSLLIPPEEQRSLITQTTFVTSESPIDSYIPNAKLSTQTKNQDISSQKKYKTQRQTSDQQSKNVAENILKCTIRQFLSTHNASKVKRMTAKVQVKYMDAVEFIRKRANIPLGLGDHFYLLNYRQGKQEERKVKRAFYIFYQWYLRNRYVPYMINSSKVKTPNQNVYLSGKNRLLYLPNLTDHGLKKLQKNQQDFSHQKCERANIDK